MSLAFAQPKTGEQVERDRLAALDRYDILDTREEEVFDRIARLIKLTLNVEIGIVTLMDAHRQWYKAIAGSDGKQVPLELSFCKHMLVDGKAFTVPDAWTDTRFFDSPYVTGAPHVRSYAGAPLQTDDGYTIGSICAIGSTVHDFSPREQEILAELAAMAMETLELRKIANVDALTGILTRRAFKQDAQKYVALSRRHRGPLSCVTFDLDHFKSINDTYGHAGGDLVLTSVAEVAATQLRESDLFGRLGGEEFAVLLPETDALRALEVAEKLRHLFLGLTFPGSQPVLKVSASLGVATFDPDSDDIDTLLHKADEALYDAKRTGRNRSSIWHASGTLVQSDRRRVLLSGRIVFDDVEMDCSVRALWEQGGEISVFDDAQVPDHFRLQVADEGIQHDCTVTARTEKVIVVDFVGR